MTQTQNTLVWLKRLSDLDIVKRRLEPNSPELPSLTSELAAMRERLPTAILKHYDARHSRGKPAIAPVNGGICGGCHLSLPSGQIAELRHADGALHVCDNCGVFIFLIEDNQDSPSAPPLTRRRSPAGNKKSDSTPT